MIKCLPIHITGPALTAEARFLMQAKEKTQSYRDTLVKRMNEEMTDVDQALKDGFIVLAHNVVESDDGRAIWFVLHKPARGEENV